MRIAMRFLELVVGCVTLYSGLLHISNPYLFATKAASYEIAPTEVMWFLPFVLSSVMVTLGISLIAFPNHAIARLSCIALFSCFAIAQSYSWLSGTEIGCGCFGYSTEAISFKSISIPIACGSICLVNAILIRGRKNGLSEGLEFSSV
jgi:hypothetical protein